MNDNLTETGRTFKDLVEKLMIKNNPKVMILKSLINFNIA
jgi:hypothetical protein